MSEPWVLIEGGNLIDGAGNPAVAGTSVLLHGDRIEEVGPQAVAGRVPRGEELVTLDATGKSVMPGLIDAHCHLTYGESLTQEEQDLYTSVEARTLRAAWNVRKMLTAGVTSFCEPGGSYYIGVAIRDAIARGRLAGPRMTSAGRYISTSNGIADFYPTSVGVPEGSVGLLANTADEMVAAVRRHAKNGVDLIKLADSAGGNYQAFTYDEIARVTEVAHQLGKKVTIHARGSGEVSASIRAEVDWIMHGNLMSDDVIEQLATSGIPLCPTMLFHANGADFGDRVGVPPHIIERMKRAMDRSASTFHKAHDAGVQFLMGTDTGFALTPFGEWHARELELLVDYAGLSPVEAIHAGTGAAAFTVDPQVGVLAPGMLADLLIVDGDPTRDIRVLQDRTRIVTVVSRGRPLPRQGRSLESWQVEPSQVWSLGVLRREGLEEPEKNGHDGSTEPTGGTDGGLPTGSFADQELFGEIGGAQKVYGRTLN
ncbi:MAG TPA: amidohydrolase family protein [Acidimicrobiales bacterium]|nr:amidohydrolase family protein [Acidimicrobiales bacterium]